MYKFLAQNVRWNITQKQVLPYFANLDATTITEEQIQEHFDSLDYSPKYLKDIRLVLKLSLDLVVKEKLRPDNPAAKIELESSKKLLGIEIEHLEQDRQEVWLDIFEKDIIHINNASKDNEKIL